MSLLFQDVLFFPPFRQLSCFSDNFVCVCVYVYVYVSPRFFDETIKKSVTFVTSTLNLMCDPPKTLLKDVHSEAYLYLYWGGPNIRKGIL